MKNKKKEIDFHWFKNKKRKKINTNSWFNTKSILNKEFNIYDNKEKPINKYLCCKTIEIFPNIEQKNIILKWMDLFIDMYNHTNYFINNNIYDFTNRNIKSNVREILNFRRLRDNYLKDKKNNTCKDGINKHMLDEAINHCVAKHKTCITNYFGKNIKFFKIKNMKKNRRKKILIIEKGLFSKKKNGFCLTKLKEMMSSEPIGVNKTSILQYDKHLNKFTLFIPIEKETANIDNRTKCGIDPGIRTFLTCYSEKEILEIGENCYEKYKINYNKIDKTRELFDKKEINKKQFTKSINHNFDKIRNLTKDLHFKVSNTLCKKFNIITIGKISTSSVVLNTNNLNKISKRCMLSLSHFRFREILQYQCNKYNTQLKIVDESYTTKTCSNCNELNNIGSSKKYNCKNCNFKCDRDINASLNIFLK